MSDWAKEELGGAALGDRRRVARLVRTTELLSEHPGKSVPDACESWADTEGTYRLWSNPRVKTEAIFGAHFRCTAARAEREEMVLVVQDGSSLDLTTHKGTKGLGYLEGPYRRGLFLHPSLVVTPTGLPLGLIDAQVWARPDSEFGKAAKRKQLSIIDKESYIWLLAWENAQKRLPTGVHVLGVADQEADIFELFAAPRRPNADLLVRATGDRSVKHPAALLSRAIREQPPAGTLTVEVPRRPELPTRTAKLTLRFAPLVLRPRTHNQPEVQVWAILVEEEHAPKGVEPLSWLLLTTKPVTTVQAAIEMVGYYKRRWIAEQYFYVLKDGCKVEELHLESADAMERALACYGVVAWRQLFLTVDARLDPHGSAAAFLADHEWQALLAHWYPKLHPRLRIPMTPPSKREAIRLIARLGGFLARKGDGEPGAKTVWRGLGYLHGLAEGFRAARELPDYCPEPGL